MVKFSSVYYVHIEIASNIIPVGSQIIKTIENPPFFDYFEFIIYKLVFKIRKNIIRSSEGRC